MTISEYIDEMKTVKDALETYLYDADLPEKFHEKIKTIIWAITNDAEKIEKSMQTNLNCVASGLGTLGKANTKKSEQDSETMEEQIQKLKSADGIIQIPEDTGSVFFGHTDADVFKAYSRGMRDAADAAYYFSDELAEAQECDL